MKQEILNLLLIQGLRHDKLYYGPFPCNKICRQYFLYDSIYFFLFLLCSFNHKYPLIILWKDSNLKRPGWAAISHKASWLHIWQFYIIKTRSCLMFEISISKRTVFPFQWYTFYSFNKILNMSPNKDKQKFVINHLLLRREELLKSIFEA